MSKYTTAMEGNPARLAITYKRGETREQDQYSWGIAGSMPIAHLIGFIVRVQAELAFRNPEPCDDMACVIVYKSGKLQWFVNSGIPIDPLVGTLELVKATLVDNQLMAMMQHAQQASQTGLIDSTGKPILKVK